jgi:hypothetical protein
MSPVKRLSDRQIRIGRTSSKGLIQKGEFRFKGYLLDEGGWSIQSM